MQIGGPELHEICVAIGLKVNARLTNSDMAGSLEMQASRSEMFINLGLLIQKLNPKIPREDLLQLAALHGLNLVDTNPNVSDSLLDHVISGSCVTHGSKGFLCHLTTSQWPDVLVSTENNIVILSMIYAGRFAGVPILRSILSKIGIRHNSERNLDTLYKKLKNHIMANSHGITILQLWLELFAIYKDPFQILQARSSWPKCCSQLDKAAIQ